MTDDELDIGEIEVGGGIDPSLPMREVDLSKIQSFDDLYYLLLALDVRIVVDPYHPMFKKVEHLLHKEEPEG